MGLFDNIDNIENSNGLDNVFESIKKEIYDYIDNTYVGHWVNKIRRDSLVFRLENGKIIVDCLQTIKVYNVEITTLQNDLFEWGYIDGGFYAEFCHSLKDLKGAPKEVNGCFSCNKCSNLESLEGAPEKVKSFSCTDCIKLKSLEHISQHIQYGLSCDYCESLKSFHGCPNTIGGPITYMHCINLKDLSDKPHCSIETFNQ